MTDESHHEPSAISNISDTARWVAVYRSWESARPDALFRDPFAERLAGEKGRAVARLMPRQARNGWPIIARTKLMDDLILDCVARGCNVVVNLAAGLDTRPYRMALPASLYWIEVDLPAMVQEKEQLLAHDRPICQLTRRGLDLLDPAQRASLLAELAQFTGSSAQALVISEGLLLYLEESAVSRLTLELAAAAAVRWWIFDLISPKLLQTMQSAMGRALENAPMKFGPAEGVGFFEARGWEVLEVYSLLKQAGRMRRLPWPMRPFARFPDPNPRRLGGARWSAVVRLERKINAS